MHDWMSCVAEEAVSQNQDCYKMKKLKGKVKGEKKGNGLQHENGDSKEQ